MEKLRQIGVGKILRDRLGGIVGYIPPSLTSAREEPVKCLFTAHKDTIGFMVKELLPNGELRVIGVGKRSLERNRRQPVVLYSERVGTLPGTAQSQKKKRETTITVDVGASSDSECASMGISVGDPVAFLPEFKRGGKKGELVESAYLDNRLGCFILLEVLKEVVKEREHPGGLDLFFAFSSQEEVGSRGAATLANMVDPDVCFVVDATWEEPPVKLGSGPVITMMDAGTVLPTRDRDAVLALAEKEGIPVQLEVYNVGATDAAKIVVHGTGVKTICVLPPTRNPHKPREVAHVDDVRNAIELLTLLSRSARMFLDSATSQSPAKLN
ncbi:MAG: M42 family metallopeptidase [Promethearchaeota archaeon]